jgi:hypothetical protein
VGSGFRISPPLNIPVQLLKVLDKQSLQLLATAINKAISNQEVPKELGIGILLPLPKTNSPSKLSDFRPIVVLSVLYRLFSSIINFQFMEILERANIIHPAQRGFMRKGSTMDHLITFNTALNYKVHHKQEIHAIALDIKNAYGSVIHSKLIAILKKHGFKSSVTNLIKSMLDNSVIKVLVNGWLSSPFPAKLGVPQGDPCSPAWFNVYINSATNICDKLTGIQVHNITIHMLLYADDILLVANNKKELQKAIKQLSVELKKLGLVLAPHKCQLIALTSKSTLSRASVTVGEVNITPTPCMEYLGGKCTLRNKGGVSWASDEPITKANNRLKVGKAKNLNLNTITTTTMSKIVSLPRYSCGFVGVKKEQLERLDVDLAEHLRKVIGLDNTLSKAIIYSAKCEGGLGITRPSILHTIEPVCAALKLFNSTSSLTSQLALAGWNNIISTDPFWNLVKNSTSQLNWSLKLIDNTYYFVNEYDNPVNPRTDILFSDRNKYTISLLGTLDKNASWHKSVTSFWSNYKLGPYQQRLLFAHLHKAEILAGRSGKHKPYPTCHICNCPATWSHVFTSCKMCSPEIEHLYAKWDTISLKHNLPSVRLPPDHSTLSVNMEWNGIILDETLKYNTLPLIDWSNDIYCAFASYIGSCYKNCTWNSSLSLRNNRGYMIKPQTDRFQTAWDRSNIPSQPGQPNLDTNTTTHNTNPPTP